LHTLFNILAILYAVVAALVTVSYALVWYENANRDPALLTGRLRPGRLARAAWLILREAGWLTLTILIQPFGWLNRKQLPAMHDQTPILLLHGLFQSRACWWWLRLRLRRQGFSVLHAVALPPWKDVEVLTERVAKTVDTLRHRHGVRRVHLVGHSMGGIIARNYLQIRGGAGKVDCCVLLGTPHDGSRLVPFALSPLAELLMPGSAFLRRLRRAPLPEDSAILNIYSRHDNMILPYDNARLAEVPNQELTGMGHTSLLFHRQVIRLIVLHLKEHRHDHP
jgi:pimeloyl-ACP methyl ester carboxylesterase